MSEVNLIEVDQRDLPTKVKVVWCLYLVALLIGLTHIVGVILAYVWRSGLPEDNLYRSHFDGQIRLFWISLVLIIFSLLLYFVVIGPLALIAVWIYFLVMCIIGLMKAIDNRPYN